MAEKDGESGKGNRGRGEGEGCSVISQVINIKNLQLHSVSAKYCCLWIDD